MNERCRPLLAALIRSTDEFADYTKRRGTELTEDSQAEYAGQKRSLLAIYVVAFLVATALGTIIVQKLTRALGAEPNDLREAAERVERNSQSAQQARQLASNASSIASKGSAVMSEVVATMQDINAGSNKIGEIIGVIDSIAFQTESTTRVERGSEMVDRAGHTMAEILDAIRNVNDIMGEISAASIEQSTGIGEVGDAVTKMDRTTRQNASIVEQSAAAAEALSDRAQRLVGTVGVFKLAS